MSADTEATKADRLAEIKATPIDSYSARRPFGPDRAWLIAEVERLRAEYAAFVEYHNAVIAAWKAGPAEVQWVVVDEVRHYGGGAAVVETETGEEPK